MRPTARPRVGPGPAPACDIDPITRLEGHGKIDIFLDDKGDVERAYLQIPELRGFEVFSLGRPAEEMPKSPRGSAACAPPPTTWPHQGPR